MRPMGISNYMSNVINLAATCPTWVDEQFKQWMLEHSKNPDATPVLMPRQLCIDGALWIRENFSDRCGIMPDEETAQGMFAALVTIHFLEGISQEDIFKQIFEAYLRSIPNKA